ncbi:uncharacterized protein LOC108743404 [Agrilus planipennis]|uniref:Uncharacterized protein LOC108743404 n=1 Tax=Agrilus planipennis TaxID=224129 RepID=A0A1W4XEA8_AGRPL|nr:uncharacterized protein LOC108743404 [Agrilus planipennis]
MIVLASLFLLKFIDLISALILISSVLVIVVLKYLNTVEKRPILGVYRLPARGYCLKVAIFFVVLHFRKIVRVIKGKCLGRLDYFQYEKPQKLSFHEQAIDAVYFNGNNKQGDVLIMGTARRQGGLINGFIYLKIENSEFGLLELPKQPDTCLYQDKEIQEFAVENIKIESVEPMKAWKLTYKGLMKKHNNPSETFSVEIDATWRSDLPFFDFDTDVDILSMAKAIALEKWNKDYFKILKEVHQTHYEQFGVMESTVKIDGKNYFSKFDTVRDHTFGNHRNWRYFHRYAMHFISVENGDRLMAVSICAPISFSTLDLGYFYSKSDNKIYPVNSSDFRLHQHGETGKIPVDYGFTVTAGGKNYVIQVKVKESPSFYIGEEHEAKIVEMFSNFKINGKNGWGVAEFQYYNFKK